jgi:LysR family nitrogen assimilation transcriptional regulator
LELRSLLYFVRIADAGTITRAAEQLGVAQPALTRQVKLLERELKVRLFVRLPRGVRLTGPGREFLEYARKITRDMAHIKEQLHQSNERPSGQVIFGTSATVATLLVPGLVERVKNSLPEVRLKVIEANSPQLYDYMLAGGGIDLAILTNPPASRALKYTPLISEPLVLLVSPRLHGNRRSFKVRDFSNTPLIITAGLRTLMNEQIAPYGAEISVQVEVDAIEAIRILVRRGAGLTVMPVSTFHDDIVEGRLVALPIEDGNIHRMLVLAHSAEADISASVRETAYLARAEIKGIQDQLLFSLPNAKRPAKASR